ncbi:MAG: response regulator transcription factor [Alphaproteobacteria bacterium]|jgi:two-component system phosphate regulon response regulator OmpR|nr:response regulator transcription factor [Alphaproteobacteria bacterium]
MLKPQILIVDDDEKIGDLLSKLFTNNDFVAFSVLSADDARKLIKYISFNALVIDYMMPKENGIDFISSLHANNINIPSIMLTAVDDVDNKILALNGGANDYLSKPFNSQELLLRVKNLFKIRYNTTDDSQDIILCGDIAFNKINNSLKINNELINLSSLETEIFKIFINNINKIIYKEDILKEQGKPLNESNLNTLNVNIMRLRKKLENGSKKYIKTIRGKGFILSPVS